MEAETKQKSHLPEYTPNGHYGYFGYPGACCDIAIRSNNVAAVKECLEREFMGKDTRTLDGYGMVKYARRYGAEAVAKHLVAAGFADEVWPHKPGNR